MKKRNRPTLQFTDQAKREINSCRLFLHRTPGSQPERRIREIYKAARILPYAPKLYPVEAVHPVTGLQFRRKIVGQFTIVYSYLEPTASPPRGIVSVRAVRHGASEDVLFRVEESRATFGCGFPILTTGHRPPFAAGGFDRV
jgi:plasmid stabilization system protein ParE